MAFTTDLQVANLALGLLGVDTIASLASSGYTAVDQDNFDLIVGGLMSAHSWRFLRTFVALAKNAGANPTLQWDLAYDLPSDIIGWPTAVYPTLATGARPTTKFLLSGGLLYTNHTTIGVDYKKDKTVTNWMPDFIRLAMYALAAHWAVPVTEVASKAADLNALAFGTPSEQGRGGQFAMAVSNDVHSEPMKGLLHARDPIADSRFAHHEHIHDFSY